MQLYFYGLYIDWRFLLISGCSRIGGSAVAPAAVRRRSRRLHVQYGRGRKRDITITGFRRPGPKWAGSNASTVTGRRHAQH